MASASEASVYLRRLRIQLVAISSSAPKNSFAARVGLIAATKDAARLPVGNHASDDPEVFAELRRGEALHELRRLPELDLKNHGQGPVPAEPAEMEPGDFAQPLDRIGQGVDAPPTVGDGVFHRSLEDRDEEVVLAAKVQVDRAGGDTGGAGDVCDLSVEEAAGGERIDRGPQQRVTLVGSVELGRRVGGAPGHCRGHE